MSKPLILLSVPGLREKDVAAMTHLRQMTAGGEIAELSPSFPCVTCPVQANMTTGQGPDMHGIVANGFYYRRQRRVEMWTAPNECIERPQLWDLLAHASSAPHSAVWFPLHSKGCEAEFVCTPAPIHNPDGTESLWCYTRPIEMYGELRDTMGHFPLKHFWGPLANIESTRWIALSAVWGAQRYKPDFFYIYLPHLDYAAQRAGPDSAAAETAIAELDEVLGALSTGMQRAYDDEPLWLVAGEYAITPVERVAYPNRLLREAGLLAVRQTDEGELIDFERTPAFAMVDHQFSHVYVNDPSMVPRVAEVLLAHSDIVEVLTGEQRSRYDLNHERSGEIIAISRPDSWQAYYWWLDDANAPPFASTVDIHRKPGYDPVELCIDPVTRRIPLTPGLIKGSHGAPAVDESQKTVLIASQPIMFPAGPLIDRDVFAIVARHFGVRA